MHSSVLFLWIFPQVLQHILNPAFLYSFEKGEGEQLLGPPNPEGDNPESITSVFITKVGSQESFQMCECVCPC
jgi:hypothetical protein